jgi:hypothetical protein
MFGFVKSSIVAVGVGAAAFLAGCASSGNGSDSAAAASPSTAVTCSKCQVTYVQQPVSNGKRIIGYTTKPEMECPDCRSVAQNFFTSGKLEHTCAHCGVTMQTCEAH